jgi:hypothetical protein
MEQSKRTKRERERKQNKNLQQKVRELKYSTQLTKRTQLVGCKVGYRRQSAIEGNNSLLLVPTSDRLF